MKLNLNLYPAGNIAVERIGRLFESSANRALCTTVTRELESSYAWKSDLSTPASAKLYTNSNPQSPSWPQQLQSCCCYLRLPPRRRRVFSSISLFFLCVASLGGCCRFLHQTFGASSTAPYDQLPHVSSSEFATSAAEPCDLLLCT